MGLPVLFFGLVALVVIGIGIAAGAVICGVTALLVAAGLVSFSAVVGVARGSVLAGLRTFVWIAAALGGLLAGVALVAGIQFLTDTWSGRVGPWIGGLLGGISGGLLVALMVDWLLRRGAGWLETLRDPAPERTPAR